LLGVDRDRLAAGEVVKIDAVAPAVESQGDAVMSKAFALQALADACFDQQIDRALFQKACADALFDIFSAARFDHDGFDSLQVEQVREHQPCGTRADDADLSAQRFFPFAALEVQKAS
jgi:hypothetical protein